MNRLYVDLVARELMISISIKGHKQKYLLHVGTMFEIAFVANISNNSYTVSKRKQQKLLNSCNRCRRTGMTQQIFDPASEAEAEMAGAARACIVAALDHSKADAIKAVLTKRLFCTCRRVLFVFLPTSFAKWQSASQCC
jgi:hypothetical protein